MSNMDIFDVKPKGSIYPDFDKSLPVIAIDLGTNYSCTGVWKDGKVNIIPNHMGQKKNPLYIAFTDNDILFGDDAKNQIYGNPKNTIFDITKLIGKKYEDPDIKENIKYWPFEIIKEPNSDFFKIKVTYKKQEKKYTPIEILTMFLEKIKKNALDYLGQEIKNIIITMPVMTFYRPYIYALKKACTDSGLNILSILNNTSAAAYTFSYNTISEKNNNERYFLIFDLGRDNLEISVNNIEDSFIEVKSRYGNSCLGGIEFDKKLVEYCIEEFRKKTGIDIRKNEKALSRLFIYCEKAKRILSTTNKTTIEIHCLMERQDLIIDITRNKFEELCFDLFKKYIPIIENVLKDANVLKDKISEIILVGGSSRIPKINLIIQNFFNGKKVNKRLNLDECNAFGGVIKGEYMKKNKNIKNFLLLDITIISLGIEINDGIFKIMIPRGSITPSKKTELFTTIIDNQNEILIKIFEGEKELTKGNSLIGKIIFPIIPMARGQQEIEITFSLDIDLNLTVIVLEKSTGKNIKINIYHDSQDVIEFADNGKQKNNNFPKIVGGLAIPFQTNINYQNMGGNMNNMNFQNMGGNMNNMNYQNMGGNMNNMKSNEDYFILKNRINQLEIESKNKDERILKLEEEFKKFKSYFLSEGEELISLIFNSHDQTIKDFKIVAKNSDKFTIIENIIYEKYPIFKETINYFIANGKKINKYHTLKENNIKNNDVIILYILDDDN